MVKAGKQLRRIDNLLNTCPPFRQALNTRCEGKICANSVFHLAVITGNRLFAGWKENSFPVRCVHDLCNVLRTSCVSVSSTSGRDPVTRVVEFSVWAGESFTPADLVGYLEAGELQDAYFSAARDIPEEIDLAGAKLSRSRYLIDNARLIEELANRFPYELAELPNPYYQMNGREEGEDEEGTGPQSDTSVA